MKNVRKIVKEALNYYDKMWRGAFAVFWLGVTLACASFAAANIISLYPCLLDSPCDACRINKELGELGVGLLTLPFVFSPLCDVVYKYDFKE